jgi:hypothetical protein|tara:strand:- start:1088 stop:1315 length:228 start_codon:yes stop_codon:yes gene_type:complete
MKKDTNIADDNLVMGTFLVVIITMTIWSALMVNDIKRDVADIGVQLDSMRGTLTEMVNVSDIEVDTDISAEENKE